MSWHCRLLRLENWEDGIEKGWSTELKLMDWTVELTEALKEKEM